MIMYTLQDNGSSEFWSAVIFRSLAIGLGGSTCLFNNVSAAKIIKRFDNQKFVCFSLINFVFNEMRGIFVSY